MGETLMTQQETKILIKLCSAIPRMSEFNKGYLLGCAEAYVEKQKERAKDGKDQ